MALRLVKVVVPEGSEERVRERLPEGEAREVGAHALAGGKVSLEFLLPAEGTGEMLDELERTCGGLEGFRMVLLPVSAAVPRLESEEEEGDDEDGEGTPGAGDEAEEERESLRVSREELYASVTDSLEPAGPHLILVALSAVVAAVGLQNDSPAVVIGAMVIAPLLGPNVALALSTTLADVDLGIRAVRTGAAGIAIALVVAAAWGLLTGSEAFGSEIIARTRVGPGDIVLALAAGGAGVLSLTVGVAAALVGVMVAVALLPPVAAAGLLAAAGAWTLAGNALLLAATNVICINLAGVVTFLVQGVRPLSWWEADRARKASRIAVALWAGILLALIAVLAVARRV